MKTTYQSESLMLVALREIPEVTGYHCLSSSVKREWNHVA